MPKHNDGLAMLAQFMTAMGQPVSQGWDDRSGAELGMKLIAEEACELEQAFRGLWGVAPLPAAEGRANFVKELADLIYVCYWLAARLGIDINEALRLVHESNMSKLDPETCKALKRADGKVLKGPAYHAPDLGHVVRSVPVTLN